MEFTYSRDLKELNQLALDLEAFGDAHDLNPVIVHCFNLCLDELLTNIISYGYDASDPATAEAARLTLSFDGQTVQAVLSDRARPFNPLEDAPAPDLSSELEDRCVGGLGVHFCKEMMDSLSYSYVDGQNVLVLRKSADLPGIPND